MRSLKGKSEVVAVVRKSVNIPVCPQVQDVFQMWILPRLLDKLERPAALASDFSSHIAYNRVSMMSSIHSHKFRTDCSHAGSTELVYTRTMVFDDGSSTTLDCQDSGNLENDVWSLVNTMMLIAAGRSQTFRCSPA